MANFLFFFKKKKKRSLVIFIFFFPSTTQKKLQIFFPSHMRIFEEDVQQQNEDVNYNTFNPGVGDDPLRVRPPQPHNVNTPRNIRQPSPIAASHLWKLMGWGWLWGPIADQNAALDYTLMDPHSARTVRLVIVMIVLAVALVCVGVMIFRTWWVTTDAHRIVNKGHENVKIYRFEKQRRQRQKKQE